MRPLMQKSKTLSAYAWASDLIQMNVVGHVGVWGAGPPPELEEAAWEVFFPAWRSSWSDSSCKKFQGFDQNHVDVLKTDDLKHL